MSEQGREVTFAITAKAEAYKRELEKLPGWTADSAKKAADSWARAQTVALAQQAAGIRVVAAATEKVEKAVAAQAVTVKAAASVAGKAWGDVGKQIGALAGGPFAQLSQVVFELGPKAGAATEALGAVASVGAGVGVAATAIAAVGLAAWKLAEAGEAAADRMAQAGRAAKIPPEAAAGLAAYRRATDDLRDAWDELLVLWGGRAGFVITGVIDQLGRAEERVQRFGRELFGGRDALDGFRAGVDRVWYALVSVGSLGLVPLIRYLEQAGTAADAAAEKIGGAASKLAVDLALAEAEGEEARRKASAARGEKQLEEARKAAEAAAKARAAEALAAEKALNAALLADAADYEEKRVAMRRAAHDAVVAMDDARAAAAKKAAEEAKDLAKEVAAEQIAQARSAAAETARGLDELVGEIERVQESMREGTRRVLDGLVDVGRGTQDLLFTLAENGTRKQKKAAEQFARYMRSVEIAQTLILGIRAVAQAAASAPPPFNLPAIAAATADAAARMAALIATKIPTAYSGKPGSGSGDGAVLVHRNESILTARETNALLRLLSERLSPLSALEGLATPAAAGGDVYLDRRKVGRVLSRGGPPPGYRRPAR